MRIQNFEGMTTNLNYKIATNELNSFVHTVDDTSSLSIFMKPIYPAVIWNRAISAKIQSWFDKIDPNLMPNFREILHKDEFKVTIEQVFEKSLLPQEEEIKWLMKDIINLANVFSDLMKVKFVRLRFDTVSTNSCRKFHVDAVTGRLICTYRGTGTQYGISLDHDDPEEIYATPTGSPILLRGTLWSENPCLGILHRSPPIEGSEETRFVLVIDPIVDPENEI